MVSLTSLWLPVLLSGVFVFVASSVIHMFLPIHRKDWSALPDEKGLVAALKATGTGPGNYMFPHCGQGGDFRSEEMKAKFQQGPIGFLTVRPPGGPGMGKALGQWFVYTLVTSIFVAYVAGRTLAPGTDYLHVFQIAGAVAFVSYAMGAPLDAIWKGQAWSTCFKFMFDGLIYALVTAGVFGWLWPR